MTFEELFSLLQQVDEHERIEAKKSTERLGNSALETICAFCNEPGLGGGYLILGLTKNHPGVTPHYQVTGVIDPDKLQNEIVSLCRQNFSISIRPIIEVIQHPQAILLLVYIPEAEPHEKPVYIKSLGLDKGSYRRIGPADLLCTKDDLDTLYQLRSRRNFDESSIEEASYDDFDPQAITAYRELRKDVKPSAQELQLGDEELLLSLGAIRRVKKEQIPTLAGLVLFGKEWSLRRLFPMSTRIDYIIIDGREWVPDPERRYKGIEFRESILLAFPRILNAIMRDIPEAFVMPPGEVYRRDVPLVPRIVIKEALCNAIMHRDYRVNQTIQILRYANRIEFRNAGYSLKPEDQLGLPGSMTRNGRIAKVMQDLNLAETKGTGIRTMREEMRKSNLSIPLFESDRASNSFALTLLTHHFFDQGDIKWLGKFKACNLSNDEARTLIAVREMGVITNADYRNINSVDTLTASFHLRRLRDLDLLEQRGNGNATYYVPQKKLLSPIEEIQSTQTVTNLPHSSNQTPPSTPIIGESTSQLSPIIGELTSQLSPIIGEQASLPIDLKNDIKHLKKRAPPAIIRSIIVRICSVNYFRLIDIAKLLSRGPEYLRAKFLSPMKEDGELELLFPHQPNHPYQAYRTKKR
jgi:ATP-dependent DNA helicase RecG